MKFHNLFGKLFFIMILFTVEPLTARDRLAFTVAPDTIEYGKEFIFTCSLSGASPLGIKIKTWDWCIIDWNYDRIDTLAAFHSEESTDSCTWNGILTGLSGHIPSKTSAPNHTYILVRAIDTNSNAICGAKDIFLSSNSSCPGCLEDVMYTPPPPGTLFAHQTLISKSKFYDDDYYGHSIDYWSWRVVLLSANGYETMAAMDSVHSHDSCEFSVTIDSLDLSKRWITSDAGTLFGFMNVYAIASDSVRYNNAYIFQYSNQPTGVCNSETIPLSLCLSQNFPNPFNPVTTISYQLRVASGVSLKVYDVLGREAATLVNGRKPPGKYMLKWDASHLPSGVYFYRLQTDSFSETRKLVLVK